jgi:hypothetical protein
MLREFEWSQNAKNCLRESGLKAFEVEEAVRLAHHGRRPNRGQADWIIWSELPEGRGTLVVRYVWPPKNREDEARARLVSLWVK